MGEVRSTPPIPLVGCANYGGAAHVLALPSHLSVCVDLQYGGTAAPQLCITNLVPEERHPASSEGAQVSCSSGALRRPKRRLNVAHRVERELGDQVIGRLAIGRANMTVTDGVGAQPRELLREWNVRV